MSERAKPWIRRDGIKVLLTARDLALFQLLYLLQFLTTPQIEQLVFAGTETRRVTRRLRLLFDAGYLARIPLRVGMNLEVVHVLGQLGAAQLALRDGIGATQFSFRESKATDHHDWPFLWHATLISEVYTRLLPAIEAIGGSIDWWIAERSLKAERLKTKPGRRAPVIPDALFAISNNGDSAQFALEVVRTTNDPGPWKRKIQNYSDYVISGLYEETYGHRAPTVMTIVAGDDGAASHQLSRLKTWTEDGIEDRSVPRSMFHFTTFDDLSASSFFRSPIWRVAGRSDPIALARNDEG